MTVLRLRDRAQRLRVFSPLTARILVINLFAPVLLVAGFLYLDQYRNGLIDSQIDALFVQGDLMAGALAEASVVPSDNGPRLDIDLARQIVRRLSGATETRVRLFEANGGMLADSRLLAAAGRDVSFRSLPPPDRPVWFIRLLRGIAQRIAPLFARETELPPYEEVADQRAENYDEVVDALGGETSSSIRDAGSGRLVISVAVPVQGLRKVVGALLLDVDSRDIEQKVRTERLNVIALFTITLIVMVILSLYLASTIARPVRMLAEASERVAASHERAVEIPDFGYRRDEIGELSESLRTMTSTLYARLDAIESFAADVSHEIKNPLTSMRSAIETVGRTNDPEKQARLLQIIKDDVSRLNRLITDISDASRLDAELTRAATRQVELAELLRAIATIHADTADENTPVLALDLPEDDALIVLGFEGRLAQVVRNLVANAISFSPRGGGIRIRGWREAGHVLVTVDDDGPGIPPDKLDDIFGRFYSERPRGEAFGTHSGLGLSISRQIIEHLGGTLTAENRRDAQGQVVGARFLIKLPG